MQVPLVSIVCTTYNHQAYIKDALEGFIKQKTNFQFEIIVHDDASTDNTAKIIREYEAKFPELFANIYQKENQYSKNTNEVEKIVIRAARGKYIALCEGDDYWTDPLKLQKQVDFLEKNQEINLCFHQVNYIGLNNHHLQFPQNSFEENNSQFFTYENVLEYWGINTCSIVFRKTFVEIPFYLTDFAVGDQLLCYFINLDKNFYYISDIMASYRITETGFTGTILKNQLKSKLEFPLLDKINYLTNNKYRTVIKKRKLRTIMKDLKTMKYSGMYSFRNRIQFYIRNFHFFLGGKKGIKLAAYSLLNYVI